MPTNNIVFRKSVGKDLRSIPKPEQKRILSRIQNLSDDPRPSGCKKLSGQERYRIRQGGYRILYEILDTKLIVTVVKVGSRKDIYR